MYQLLGGTASPFTKIKCLVSNPLFLLFRPTNLLIILSANQM